ncbi:MAG: DUF368 domain-containing protein [Lachnospiraceae bacterium]
MNFIIDIVKGIFVGIANIIPGVSGGTMAVSLGIYDKLLSSISNLLKQFKKSVMLLLPILIGCAIGIVGFSYAIKYLLAKQPFITSMVFVGLILGGIPMLIMNRKEGKARDKHNTTAVNILVFLIFLALALILPMLGGEESKGIELQTDVLSMIKLFFVGVIASATMVVPGVSGSLVLMILGYYFGIIGSITDFIDALKAFDVVQMMHLCMILVPFGLGVLVGIFAIAKLIEWLFHNYCSATYSGILGLIVASPFAIFYKVDALSSVNLINGIIGVLLLLIGALVTYQLGKREGNA